MVEGLLKASFGGETLSRLKFYAKSSYNIGGFAFNLNDIENGVLRANRVSAVPMTSIPFGPSDPRLQISLKVVDPRIHFALNCGAQSWPPCIKLWGPELSSLGYITAKDKCRAILTGKKSNITVLDFDDVEEYDNIIVQHPELKNNYTVKSPNGYHIYFLYNAALKTGVVVLSHIIKLILEMMMDL